jgi:hypothetical protein
MLAQADIEREGYETRIESLPNKLREDWLKFVLRTNEEKSLIQRLGTCR